MSLFCVPFCDSLFTNLFFDAIFRSICTCASLSSEDLPLCGMSGHLDYPTPDTDIEELEKMDASEVHARRLKAKEVLTLMSGKTSSQSQMEQLKFLEEIRS